MDIGQILLLKYKGILRKGRVKALHTEDLDIELLTGEIIQKKFWEIRKIEKNEENKYSNIP